MHLERPYHEGATERGEKRASSARFGRDSERLPRNEDPWSWFSTLTLDLSKTHYGSARDEPAAPRAERTRRRLLPARRRERSEPAARSLGPPSRFVPEREGAELGDGATARDAHKSRLCDRPGRDVA